MEKDEEIIRLPYRKSIKRMKVPSKQLIKLRGFDSQYFFNQKDEKAVKRALENPLGSPSLRILCKGKKKIAILVDDNTRPTPAAEILPPIINNLKSSGIKEENIVIIIAKGTHPSLKRTELEKKVGKKIVCKFKVIQHKADDLKEVVCIGKTVQGPVFMNKYAAEADLRIGIGQLSLSPFAGISSGAKLWLPGISSSETIQQNHQLAKDKSSDFGILDDNALRRDMEKAASLIGENFYLGVILNFKKEIIYAVAGDMVKAHRKGAKELKKHIAVNPPQKVDNIIISTYPYDFSFYHALHKLLIVKFFLKKGGNVLCLTFCPEGLGPVSFLNILKNNFSEKKIRFLIGKKKIMPDKGYMALRVKEFLKDFNLFIYTKRRLRREIKRLGISCINSLDNFIIKEGKVLVLPSAIILTKDSID